MEKQNLNVIIFDEDQSSSRHHRDTRTVHASKHQQNHQYQIIQQEIHYLSQKIKALQQQTDNQFLLKNQSNATNKLNSEFDSNQHAKTIQLTIQKKIQITIKETRKIVDKLADTFQKKLDLKLQKKNDDSGLNKIKQNYSTSIKKIEQFYKKQVDRLSKEYKQTQNKMLLKVNQVQQKLVNKINQLNIKQKEYVDWIHHLQIKLQDFQNKQKNKKHIQITQDKIVRKQTSSENSQTVKNNQNNYSDINHVKKISPQPKPNPNDSSKIQRKHRIFGDNNRGSSISPNDKIASNNQSSVHNYNSTFNNGLNSNNFINGNSLATAQVNQILSSKVINPHFKIKNALQSTVNQQKATVSLATRSTQPLKPSMDNNSQASPWRVIDKSIEKSYGEISKRNKVVQDIKEDSFYKDIPKVNQGWQKFQDFKEIDVSSSESEQDVLFYRQGDRHQQFLQNFRSSKSKQQDFEVVGRENKRQTVKASNQGQQKFFSPFDLS